MSPVFLADLLVTVHLAFMVFVIVGLVLILAGAVLRWGWVRNFWFRLGHLLSIGFVAAEATIGMKCPLTVWEAALRGHERNVEGASAVGVFAIRVLYYEVPEEQFVYFYYGYMAFAALVLLAFIVAPPRMPWRKASPRPAPEQPHAQPPPPVALPPGHDALPQTHSR